MINLDRPELFLIPHSTIDALSKEEVEATYSDMEQLDIAKLPYPRVDIGIPGAAFTQFAVRDKDYKPDSGVQNSEFRIRCEDGNVQDVFLRMDGKPFFSFFRALHEDEDNHDLAHELIGLANLYMRTLIVLLATKNIVKTRKENKSIRLGIGTKNIWKPLYTTTLTLPPQHTISESSSGEPGYSLRPHLRRGHIRNQRYGPKIAFSRQVWIEPCFINADENFISSRTAYNTSLGEKP